VTEAARGEWRTHLSDNSVTSVEQHTKRLERLIFCNDVGHEMRVKWVTFGHLGCHLSFVSQVRFIH
jgi:hypothetical protein